ncbi:MAG: HAD family phosphatase [Paracoccaceae bacterium]|jgi:2-haloacid dehalogenase
MTPKAVIFDIGNVLIEWEPERFYDNVIGPETRRALFSEVDLTGMNTDIDEGALFKETIYETARKNPKWRAEIEMWYDRWIDIASPRIEGSIRLLRLLRDKDIPVFTLTNFGIYSFEYAQTQYDFLNEFDRYYVSGRLGVVKPDPAIFACVEQDCGLCGAELIFVDDRADNITAARARGWQVHKFINAKGWGACLAEAGLLTMAEGIL